jgi:hypothetical protein
MSREVLIATWCDPCAAEDRQTPGVEWLVELTGERRVIDLCEQHVESWGLVALAAQMSKYGRAPERPVKRAPSRAAAEVQSFACTEPDCGRSFPTAQGLTMHRTRKHSPAGAEWGKRPAS